LCDPTTPLPRGIFAILTVEQDVAAPAKTSQKLLRVGLMGPVAAIGADGCSVLPRGRKARALLALLAQASPEPLRRARLTALLWSGRGEEQGRASLRQCLHELATALGPAADLLAAERHDIALRGAGLTVWLDPQGHPARLMEDLAGIDPALDRHLGERRRDRLRGATARAEAVLAARTQPAERLAAAEALLVLEPTHEGGWRAAMQAHAEAGSPCEAQAAYDRCVATLAGTLGMPPSAETQALAAALRRHEIEPDAARQAVAWPAAWTSVRPARNRLGVRVGVMPLRALSSGGGDDLGGLSLGLADEITTALARFRWLFLIASPSIAAVAGAARTTEPNRGAGPGWRELDLDFLLDGTIQQAGGRHGRVRVSLRLLDLRSEASPAMGGAPAGEVVWSGRFERDADDLLTLQDEIAAEAVAQIDPELMQHESRRAGLRPASSATAYDLVLRAIPALYQLEEAEFLAAGRALERAVALDPAYAAAHAWLAYWHIFLVGQGWTASADPPLTRDAAMARAGALAERAVRLDPADARALTVAGHVRAFLHRDTAGAMALHARALALNPNLPLAWAFSGLALCYRGDHAAAVARIEQARRLSPFDPNAFYYDTSLMVPHLVLGHFAQVVELGRRVAALNPSLSSTFKVLLSALGHLGAADEAAQVRARLYRLEPGYSLTQAAAHTTFLRPEDNTLFLEGLRLAGLPRS